MNNSDSNFDQFDELIATIRFEPDKLREGIENDPYITVGEARRMSRLTIEKNQFPAFQKALSMIEEQQEDESPEEIADDDVFPDVPQNVTMPSAVSRKPAKKAEQTDDDEEESPINELELFDMIDNIESSRAQHSAPSPDFSQALPQEAELYDPYNTKLNNYDIDELLSDIPTFELDSGYRLEGTGK